MAYKGTQINIMGMKTPEQRRKQDNEGKLHQNSFCDL